MNASADVNGDRVFLRWVLAALGGGIIPGFAFWTILTWPWDFDAQPPCTWAVVGFVPLVSVILLFVRAERSVVAARWAILLFALHAVAMLGFLAVSSAAGIALFLDLFLIAALLLPVVTESPPGRLAKSTIVWVAALFGVGFPAALGNAAIVAWRAETIAGERPYCIEYASQTDAFEYEPARTLFDLSALKMQARLMEGGSSLFHFQHHAILVVGEGTRSFFNWSYMQENFVDEVLNRGRYGPKVACRPERHFATRLAVWSHQPGLVDVSVSGRHFAIPEAYRPREVRDKIMITAVSPAFAPYDISNKSQRHVAQFYSDIVIADARSVNLTALFEKRLNSGSTNVAGSEFGLSKTLVFFGDPGLPFQQRPLLNLYSGYDSAGTLQRIIECDRENMRPTPTCRYQFEKDGLVFSLTVDDPSQWKTIEQKLAETFMSFETHLAESTAPQ
jgi:hypothetical protein